MKLSDIKGDRVFDVIADIIEPACNIATDDEAGKFFKRDSRPEDMSVREFTLKQIKEALPPLLKTHKEDLIKIMATLDGISPEEYKKNLTMAGLFQGLYEILTDEDLLSFLS